MAFRMEPLPEVLEEDSFQQESSLSGSAEMQSGDQTTNATCHQVDEQFSLSNCLVEDTPNQQVQAQRPMSVNPATTIIKGSEGNQSNVSKTALMYNDQTRKIGVMTGVQANIEMEVGASAEILDPESTEQFQKYLIYALQGKQPHHFGEGHKVAVNLKPLKMSTAAETMSSEIQVWDYERHGNRYTVKHDKVVQTYKHNRHHKGVSASHKVQMKHECTSTNREKGTNMTKNRCLRISEDIPIAQNESPIFQRIEEKVVPPQVVVSRLSLFSKRLNTLGTDLHELLAGLRLDRSKHFIPRAPQASACGSSFYKPPFKGPTRSSVRNHLGGKFRKRGRSPTRNAEVGISSMHANMSTEQMPRWSAGQYAVRQYMGLNDPHYNRAMGM